MSHDGHHRQRESLSGDWIDEVFRALSRRPRRMTVSVLLENGPMSVDELVAYLAGVSGSERGEISTETDHERVLVGLTHVHLPELERTGLVTRDGDEVSAGERAELAGELLGVIAAHRSPVSDEQP
jgi:DNA-binding transcriptional ArsR family regulator